MPAGGNIASIREAKAVTAPPLGVREGGGDGRDYAVLPPGCPVTPLGIQGLKLWLLDASNQLTPFPTDCRKGDMTLIFGGERWLKKNFPQLSAREAKMVEEGAKPEDVASKFDQAKAQAMLIEACFQKGIFNPQGRVFGRGAHRSTDDEDELVLHLGKAVLRAGARDAKGKVTPGGAVVLHPAGQVGEGFYPALDALPAPADDASTTEDARKLIDEFDKWHWVEGGGASPILLLGMVAQMFICGALRWRSHLWLAGPTAAGKSTLQALIRAIHGRWCLHVEDASEAAIRQVLGDDTLPVMIDEAEADDNPDKQQAILNLAKKASSGAKIIRGGADHKGQEFTAQSCFLFSSVLHSLKKGEERNRMAILELRQVPAASQEAGEWVPPDMQQWKATGRKMHRRMIEQWPRFARTLADYKREIWSHGLEGRWQDTFGTLLACADCLLYDRAPSAEDELSDVWGREKRLVRLILPMMKRGKSEARSDVDRCLAHLLGVTLAGAHGAAPETVGQWIVRAMLPGDDMGNPNDTARSRLKQVGLRIVTLRDGERGWGVEGEPLPTEDAWDDAYLLVAYPTSQPLGALFARTEWAGGNWLQSLGKIDGVVKGIKARFSGPKPDNAIAIPLRKLREGDEGEMAAD